METVQNRGNKVVLKDEFDEQTKLQLKSLLEDIDRNQQSSYQNMTSEGKQKYIIFESDAYVILFIVRLIEYQN